MCKYYYYAVILLFRWKMDEKKLWVFNSRTRMYVWYRIWGTWETWYCILVVLVKLKISVVCNEGICYRITSDFRKCDIWRNIDVNVIVHISVMMMLYVYDTFCLLNTYVIKLIGTFERGPISSNTFSIVELRFRFPWVIIIREFFPLN